MASVSRAYSNVDTPEISSESSTVVDTDYVDRAPKLVPQQVVR